ncbi:MAG: hypothetical protein LBD41_07870 [Clostridiales Family XIII bacterium]|jgi:hypothetical protein|nr:hypothetical protein [Clostridiales Family XIII bacterium]
MSKQWKPNVFRYLEKNWVEIFQKDQEKWLNDKDNWLPNKDADPPINNEYAIPLENQRIKK